jgi:hypothetical protein
MKSRKSLNIKRPKIGGGQIKIFMSKKKNLIIFYKNNGQRTTKT